MKWAIHNDEIAGMRSNKKSRLQHNLITLSSDYINGRITDEEFSERSKEACQELMVYAEYGS